ncbi:MAG: sensor histidine kinase [Alphaproteobacteria bacterium]
MAEAEARVTPAKRAVAAVFVLLGLVLVLVLVLAAAMIWQGHREARMALEGRAVSSAYVASTHVRWLVEANLQALRRIADTVERSSVPLESMATELQDNVAALPGAVPIWVFDADGAAVFATDPGLAPAEVAGQDYFVLLRDGARWNIGPLRVNRATGRKVFPIGYRIDRGGDFIGAAVIFVPADLMAQFWRSMDLGENSSVGLLRDDGWMVARYPIPQEALNLADYELFTEHLPNAPEGTYAAAASPADGIGRIVAYRKVEGLPLVVAVGVPLSELATSFWHGMGDVLLAGIPVALGLLLVSLWVVKLLRKEERAHRALAEAHARNQMLLREIHHRVKNNLQTVSALVRLQPGPAEPKEELMRRILAMSVVHEHIHSSDRFDRIDLADYVRTLVAGLEQSHGNTVRVDCTLQPVVTAVEQAHPLGLILNEVVSNAMKHAFPDGRPGRISLSLALADPGHAVLRVWDDGIGYRPDCPSGMGLSLVEGLVKQIGGDYQLSGEEGTTFVLTFPILDPDVAAATSARAAE